MNKERHVFLLIAALFFGFVLGWLLAPAIGRAEDPGPMEMYVEASLLNGRAEPNKKAKVEALFDQGNTVTAWCWSENHHWIEVTGGETGTVWVWYEFLNEETEPSIWVNDYGSKVKIRKEPFGTVIGYLKNGKEVEIEQIIFGWGRCSRGWIDLFYLTEER